MQKRQATARSKRDLNLVFKYLMRELDEVQMLWINILAIVLMIGLC